MEHVYPLDMINLKLSILIIVSLLVVNQKIYNLKIDIMSDKQRVISDIYYVRGNFGYKQITVNDSRKVDESSQ